MIKKKKLFLLTFMIFLLTACNKDVVFINIPTAATTGALYPFGNSLAALWNSKLDKVRVNAQASNGGIDNLNLLYRKEADVSMAVASNVYQSYMGLEKFKGRENKNLRVIAGLYYNPNQIVVTKSSNINSFEDFKGKRFAPGAPGSTTEDETSVHLKVAGLMYPDDINPQYVGFTEAIDLVRNKQADGAWIMAGAPTSAVTEMLKTTDTKILEVPKDFVEKLKVDYPWYSNFTLKAGVYEEIDSDINTSAIKMLMFTRADMDEEVVYKLTKAFWENLDELKKVHGFLKDLTIENTLEDIANLPLHPGAERYYKEVGILK